jgi:hypothetical protein
MVFAHCLTDEVKEYKAKDTKELEKNTRKRTSSLKGVRVFGITLASLANAWPRTR